MVSVHSPDRLSSSDQAGKATRFKWPNRGLRAAEFSYVMRQMQPTLLLILLVIGALLGFGVWELYLVRFEAKTSLRMSGDLATFREAEPLFSSAELFERYGAKHNISNDPDFETIRQQMLRHLNSPIRIEHNFRLSRKDVRDVPDAFSKEEIGRRIGFENIQSDLDVYAIASDAERAIRLSKLAMAYARDALAAASIAALMRRWGEGSRNELAANWENTTKLRTDLASSNRRIEAMAQLRDHYKEEKDVGLPPAPASAAPPVQVQIAGTRNLSPSQQLIGLESDRADIIERLHSTELDRARLETFVRFADLYGSRVNDGASIELAREMLEETRQSRAPGTDPDPKQTALAGIGLQLQLILSRFDLARPDNLEPQASPTGLKRSVAMLFGMLGGAAIWWTVLVFRRSRSRPHGRI